jgi:hypothetical protein
MHSKFAKSANTPPKSFSLYKFFMGYQETKNFMLNPNSLKWAHKMFRKVIGKQQRKEVRNPKNTILPFNSFPELF